MKKLFEQLITTGVENLEAIGDVAKKAEICAQLASAIAQSGLLEFPGTTLVENEESKEENVSSAKGKTKSKGKTTSKKEKEALKPEAGKDTKIKEEAPSVPEEIVEEQQEVAPQEPQEPIVDPTIISEEIAQQLKAYEDAWTEDYVYNECLSAFSEGRLTGKENINGTNAEAFLIYLGQLAASFAEQ